MEIKWVRGKDNLADPYFIRRIVFIEEQEVALEEEFDDIDNWADHIVIYMDSKPVATGRVFILDGVCYLGRIAVLKEYRGKSIGKVLVLRMIEKAFDKGAREIYIHSQTHAEGFYKKLGFESYGEIYWEAGIEHVNMVLHKDRFCNV